MSKNIVLLSPIIPEENPANAGEKLVWNLCYALEKNGANVTIISTDTNNNLNKQCRFESIILSSAGRGTERVVTWIKKVRNPIDSWTPNLEFLIRLISDSTSIKALKDADVIDLQWSSASLLAPFIRKLNPNALIIGTFHDINAQRLRRRAVAEKNLMRSLLWNAQAVASHFLDLKSLSSLNKLILLSQKDEALLDLSGDKREKVAVIAPPVFDNFFGEIDYDAPHSEKPTLLFMGSLYRWENQEAFQRLAQEIMPLVWERYPEAVLRVVGPAPSQLFAGVDHRIDYWGIVDRIAEAYLGAWLVALPISLGAGVKFKTIDALLSGIPIVATNAAAEGIRSINWIDQLAKNNRDFALKTFKVIEQIDEYRATAVNRVSEIKEVYGMRRYIARVKEVYEL